MAHSTLPTFKKGLDKIRSNPQLVYTILIALFITAAFIFMSERFIGIANSAQERLINVRIGSLQDAFVSFAGDNIENPNYLNEKIRQVIDNNETIRNFRVIEKQKAVFDNDTATSTKYVIVASNDLSEMGTADPRTAFLYSLSGADPSQSLTIETQEGGERLFNTARAVVDRAGNVRAVIISTQTLSLADIAIESSIANIIVILVVVLILIMFLFLRHAKIIDYTVLYKKLQEVDELKDDFISMASHELRTPLTVIRGYAEYINESPSLDSETKDYALKIDTSAKDLDSLVADILDVSRIEQGRMTFKNERLNPLEIAESVTTSLTTEAQRKDLRLSFDKSKISGSVAILADKDRLKQALLNIVGNAIKYTKKGEVTVKTYIENNNVIIRVIDTGVGMSGPEQKKLFEKFYRIRTPETEDIRGTGLGLWITAQIIKEMNGIISVESIKGVGTHFIISFPLIK